MPRPVEADVHSSFVEFRAESDDKCVSVQCTHCHQVRAKNTTRQRAHLMKCKGYLSKHPDTFAPGQGSDDASGEPTFAVADALDDTAARTDPTLNYTPNPRINGRPSLGQDGTPTPKKHKSKHNFSNYPDLPLHEVHAAFDEYKANDNDKTMSARCRYCNQTRAKNTSRQREHLMSCAGYASILREKIPANSLLHEFDPDDIASSVSVPAPTLELDFRMSIQVKPALSVGAGNVGVLSWVSCRGGHWAGRWGKGVILPAGQDTQTAVSDTATRISARYLLQTNDEDPAPIICNIGGWLTAEKEIMEKLNNPVAADNVPASRYKLRVTMELESGDPRYPDLKQALWVGSGCRRGTEIVYDFYRAN
ncbi:hypothetical protein B0T16DRAFT_425423 [Cercophora newfieldiana]|uniref:Uncharacterized protein n=1 Tax=Cercophora newfieldiana TaxID=92897 RepID=A0AA40CZ76_9PEZI|nr:hypothetical protein B0T16DRAFT_425423 [Cercophora newfieldiana]